MNERRASDAAGESWRKWRPRDFESHTPGPACDRFEVHVHMADGSIVSGRQPTLERVVPGTGWGHTEVREEGGDVPMPLALLIVIVVGFLCTLVGYAWGMAS